jgi:hypothetical protein
VKKPGPFKITQIINPVANCLKLPAMMKIHNVFHVSLLMPKSPTSFNTVTLPPIPVIIDDQKWEIPTILDFKPCGHGGVYLVDWVGYGAEEQLCLPLENLCNTMDNVHALHNPSPDKPCSPSYTY